LTYKRDILQKLALDYVSNIGRCVQNCEGLTGCAVWLLWADMVRICGRKCERSTKGVFGGFLWGLWACGVRSVCGVALWLSISACVGFPWRGACSCVGACGFAPCGAFKWLGAFARGVRVGLGVDGVRGGGGRGIPTRIFYASFILPCYPHLPR
jgi:hypothetical protein